MPALAAGLLLCGCRSKEETSPNPVVTVDVAPVLSAPIQRTIRADALLYPLQQAAIVPKISAPIKKFYVDRGARVRVGQVLAELENGDLAGALTENKAALDQAEANYQTVSKATVPEEAQKAELDVRGAKDAMDDFSAAAINMRKAVAASMDALRAEVTGDALPGPSGPLPAPFHVVTHASHLSSTVGTAQSAGDAAAVACAAVGLSQQECTRALRLWGIFGSILAPWRTTQRKAAWIWGPGQPNRS